MRCLVAHGAGRFYTDLLLCSRGLKALAIGILIDLYHRPDRLYLLKVSSNEKTTRPIDNNKKAVVPVGGYDHVGLATARVDGLYKVLIKDLAVGVENETRDEIVERSAIRGVDAGNNVKKKRKKEKKRKKNGRGRNAHRFAAMRAASVSRNDAE